MSLTLKSSVLTAWLLVQTHGEILSLGTDAPPSHVAGNALEHFPVDTRDTYSYVSTVATCFGNNITFSEPLYHLRVPDDWGTWSHDFEGDIYLDWSGGDVTIVLPPLGAFVFYAEPNFGTQTFVVETNIGDSVTEDIAGSYGANGFAVYASGGAPITSVQITNVQGSDFAVGEFYGAPLASIYVCSDGCEIPDEWVDDGYCDCLDCGDEAEWSCSTCCCASECGKRFFCAESTCFLDLGFKNWGWSNGPFAADEDFDFELPMYQAEGQCQAGNGQHTADVEGNYTVSAGVWEIHMHSMDGYAIAEWHAYVGCEALPRDRKGGFTAAPGQYPYGDEFEELTTEATFTDTLDQDCAEFYVVVHAVIHEEGDEETAETAYMRTCIVG